MLTISIKDLRKNLATVADQVLTGKSFTVFRRSKPVFKIVPIEENFDEEDGWVDFIDFTEGGEKDGMKAEEFLKILRSVDK